VHFDADAPKIFPGLLSFQEVGPGGHEESTDSKKQFFMQA
jgi:hypothetical protein